MNMHSYVIVHKDIIFLEDKIIEQLKWRKNQILALINEHLDEIKKGKNQCEPLVQKR